MSDWYLLGISADVQAILNFLNNDPKGQVWWFWQSRDAQEKSSSVSFMQNVASCWLKKICWMKLLRSVIQMNLLTVKFKEDKKKSVIVLLSHLKLQTPWPHYMINIKRHHTTGFAIIWSFGHPKIVLEHIPYDKWGWLSISLATFLWRSSSEC